MIDHDTLIWSIRSFSHCELVFSFLRSPACGQNGMALLADSVENSVGLMVNLDSLYIKYIPASVMNKPCTLMLPFW